MQRAPALIKAWTGEIVFLNVHTALKGTTHVYDMTGWEGPVPPSLTDSQFQGQIANKTDLIRYLSYCNKSCLKTKKLDYSLRPQTWSGCQI